MASEIVEEGITRIVVMVSATTNGIHTPAGGTAKWFRDELDQVWVKFVTAPQGFAQRGTTHVYPASRVVEVRY